MYFKREERIKVVRYIVRRLYFFICARNGSTFEETDWSWCHPTIHQL